MYTHFVTMTYCHTLDYDKRIIKMVYMCRNVDDAITAQRYGLCHPDYRSIHITKKKPYYTRKRYVTEYRDFSGHETRIKNYLEVMGNGA